MFDATKIAIVGVSIKRLVIDKKWNFANMENRGTTMRKFKIIVAAIFVTTLIAGSGVPRARGPRNDNCKASCEIKYKRCVKSCKGHAGCTVKCREQKSSCARGCGS